MRILLLDSTVHFPSNPLFLEAFEELYSEADYRFVDEAVFFRPLSTSMMHKVAYRILGRRPLTYWSFNQAFIDAARDFHPDVVLVVKGLYIRSDTLRLIKQDTGAVFVNFATDDPFNAKVSTRDLRRSLPLYDLYVCTKTAIMPDVRAAGCRNVAYVPFGYKPSVHFPEQPTSAAEAERFASDVVFLGGCDADRSPYFQAVVRHLPGVRLHLYGGYWDRDPVLRPHYRGFAMARDYRLALSGAKIAPCLVRRANRDGHVMRTFEVLACGAFLLAERTDEHLSLFDEGRDMACFESPEELIDKIRYYLNHEEERRRIAAAGYHRVTTGHHRYVDRLSQIVRVVQDLVFRPS